VRFLSHLTARRADTESYLRKPHAKVENTATITIAALVITPAE
jgi:hypothetical protein